MSRAAAWLLGGAVVGRAGLLLGGVMGWECAFERRAGARNQTTTGAASFVLAQETGDGRAFPGKVSEGPD